jgi:serine/threonine protein kinase
MKLLNNEFIIKYYETFHSKSNLYIVTELVTDGDLYEYISQNPKVPERRAASIMSMLFKCVDYIHSVGVIHRDLKPENILLILGGEKGHVKSLKLIDFGLAKQVDANTKCSEGCGTPGYMGTPILLADTNTYGIMEKKEPAIRNGPAPEVIKGELYDKTVDIFSLGVIMFLL